MLALQYQYPLTSVMMAGVGLGGFKNSDGLQMPVSLFRRSQVCWAISHTNVSLIHQENREPLT